MPRPPSTCIALDPRRPKPAAPEWALGKGSETKEPGLAGESWGLATRHPPATVSNYAVSVATRLTENVEYNQVSDGGCACTIVARDYLPYARALHRSFLTHHPNGWFVVLVIDDIHDEVNEEVFEVWRPADLDLSSDEFHRMAAMYNRSNLAKALKPWLLAELLETGVEAAVYLDPDTLLFGPLTEIFSLAKEHQLVLTPHATEPMPRDELEVSETTILGSGAYNMGFLGLGQGSRKFLAFWRNRLRRDCYVDTANQRFADQRWVDFAPGMFPCYILRDPRYNVAYWNLDHRDLTLSEGIYAIDGKPLRFFHFSGFDPQVPYLLSRDQGNHPRILLSENPTLARLCAEYADGLLELRDGLERQPIYPFDELPNGLKLDDALRNAFRSCVTALEESGDELPPDPFTLEGAEAFLTYMITPARNSRVPRYVLHMWRNRHDLQVSFPEPEGLDRHKLLAWAQTEASDHGRWDPRLTAWDGPSPQGSAAPEEVRPDTPGVRVAGYLRAELGVGEMGRLALATIRHAQIPAGTFVYNRTVNRQAHPLETEDPRSDLNINLIAVNGDALPLFVEDVGHDFLANHYNIGLWAWELEDCPVHFKQGLEYLDEIWTISDFSRRSIAQMTEKPVLRMPLALIADEPSDDIDRMSLGIPDQFMFLFCLDENSIIERKNPLGLIQAFRHAFRPAEGPVLVIKTINRDWNILKHEQLCYEAADRDDIIILDKYLTSEANAALIRACDCYVSLHRSEGLGLTMAAAMTFGKPVIATDYSGNLDFMNAYNSYVVPWTPAKVAPGNDPYPQGATWASPDLDTAARLMRRVAEHPQEAEKIGQRARAFLQDRHGFEPSVAFVRKRFNIIQRCLTGSSQSRV